MMPRAQEFLNLALRADVVVDSEGELRAAARAVDGFAGPTNQVLPIPARPRTIASISALLESTRVLQMTGRLLPA